ncbi:von Willebrand factor A domain-containing protein 7-like [Limanda limanda]|uniref:von Willebrand factor A domain-containing protein 7-like n=1 Tax=Limanda limanda TaxID=27771 RepID=UPI0029C79A51|nr:von Willebrand factor A domain-containing protein 7-like [Limanda limanda]
MTAGLGVVLLMAAGLSGLVHCFQPLCSSNSSTHYDITIRAVLRKTFEVCRDIAASEGREFNLTLKDDLTTDDVQMACSSPGNSTALLSSVIFQTSLFDIVFGNAMVDVVYARGREPHFDNETFQGGRDVITAGVAAVNASVTLENFVAGRLTLGQVCHTLQDFYSHSNWVELGKKAPYTALIVPDQPLENLADRSTPTCRSCDGGNCDNNILTNVLNKGLLTSGYFNMTSSEKPAGKCSDGGSFDMTSKQDPKGGISKDDIRSSHGSLHKAAAELAENATLELLEAIRVAVGDKSFLRLMGLSQSPALCFVIDTTASMSIDIAEAKRVSFSIIDSKRGTPQEPSAYILVPFNDPGFGPLIMTTDADVFKSNLNKLSANGGGDIPELSLSGLQLALTGAPPSSEIFVFTDAPAKDALLKSTIIGLIQYTKSVVTFMVTRRRRPLNEADAQLYRDLAQASGGLAIEVLKSDFSKVTSIIEDSTASAVVTVVQVVKNPGLPDRFTFIVDGSLRNVIVYVTEASSLTFTLTSSSGSSQTSSQSSGPLASSITAGNLRSLSLNTDNQTGSWQISVDSNSPYSVKVIGQSPLDFIFYLLEAHEGAQGDLNLKERRPLSGGNLSILVFVAGSDKLKVSEVIMFDSSGPTEVNGSIELKGRGNFLVTYIRIPAGNYVVRLKGEDSSATSMSSKSSFQRQSPTTITTSSISLTAQANNTNVEPNSNISIHFTVATTNGGVVDTSATETFTVRANNDRSYTSSSPSTVTAAARSGGTASGTVTLTVPGSAVSGTDVTLTIVAENAAASDFNFAVLRFSVVLKVREKPFSMCSDSNCDSTCDFTCDSNYDSTCGFTCDSNCDSNCNSTCDSTCDFTCDSNCDSTCDFTCDFTCDSNYDSTCGFTCNSNCDSNCDSNYDSTCDSTCDFTFNSNFDSNCDSNCDSTCDSNCDSNYDSTCDFTCDFTCDSPCDSTWDSNCTGGHTLSMSRCLWITAAVCLLWK